MKNLILLLSLFAVTNLCGQIKTPAASPKCSFTQAIGLNEISVEYSRPSVKEREIFSASGLVPFGSLWRLGANQVTKISFDGDVKVGGQELAGGDYAVLCTPSASEWSFHFFNYEKSGWSSYTEKEPTLTVTAPTGMLPMSIETFTITTSAHTDNSANLEFLWDKTMVNLPIQVDVEERVMKNIESVLAGPTAGDYYTAASYYHSSGKDLNQALSWIKKATAGEDKKFWHVRREALIQNELGNKKEAIKAAELSLKLAEAAGYDEYIRLNKESIKEWSGK